ncbi:MAG: MMPL family transporter [Solirubrobacteraceae bacterium]|nr:MMPL family transporter [Solirubrobacteraceae bacterium]
MQPSRNLAGRAGRWSATHRKTAILGWITFVVLAFMVGGKIGTNTLTDEQSGVGESGTAERIVAGAYPKGHDELVLFQSANGRYTDPAFRSAVDDVSRRLRAIEGVTAVSEPYGDDRRGAVSRGGNALLLAFEIPGDPETAKVAATVDATLAATAAAQKAHPDVRVEQSGSGSTQKEIEELFGSDLSKAGSTSLPITLAVLLVAFGALMAAGIPLLLALTGIIATLGLVGPLSQLTPVDESVNHVILLIGLAVGVDYALFYLRRVREERHAGRSNSAAIEAAAATSGRAVLVSGITVMIAMAGMYFGGASTFESFATGTIAVVAVAMLGSITILPALLSLCGDRVDRGRVPGLGRLKARVASFGLWSRVVDGVMRRPLVSAVASVALLLALAAPALQMTTGSTGVHAMSQDLPLVQKYNHLDAVFPRETSSLRVVVKGEDVTVPAVTAAVEKLERSTRRRAELFPGGGRLEQDVSADRTVNTLTMQIAGTGTDDISARALDTLRDDLVPATLGRVDGLQAYTTGDAATDRDFDESMISHLPLVFGFVLVSAFLLLLVTFRSIVVPIKAIVLNLLSIGAAYGALVLVFQHGWFNGLLGVAATSPIESWIPLFMFVVLFGLSMDYHVFILTRVRELYDRGMRTEDAVASAVKSTAGVVTSAAVVMVSVFAVFGTLSFAAFKQMGVGLAFAVLLDATLIRGVLLPATMKLLGDWNWWLPGSMSWTAQVQHGGDSEVTPAKA